MRKSAISDEMSKEVTACHRAYFEAVSEKVGSFCAGRNRTYEPWTLDSNKQPRLRKLTAQADHKNQDRDQQSACSYEGMRYHGMPAVRRQTEEK